MALPSPSDGDMSDVEKEALNEIRGMEIGLDLLDDVEGMPKRIAVVQAAVQEANILPRRRILAIYSRIQSRGDVGIHSSRSPFRLG